MGRRWCSQASAKAPSAATIGRGQPSSALSVPSLLYLHTTLCYHLCLLLSLDIFELQTTTTTSITTEASLKPSHKPVPRQRGDNHGQRGTTLSVKQDREPSDDGYLFFLSSYQSHTNSLAHPDQATTPIEQAALAVAARPRGHRYHKVQDLYINLCMDAMSQGGPGGLRIPQIVRRTAHS
jgi:hypothetical protein